ncbi:MAG: S1 RNA-binding domain-containing protein [Bacilli bacterium]|nr:S1 RNA-binding domain-containing protein [Bacilli bacterium]
MYKEKDKVEGQITGVTEYGIFVKLEDNYFGLIHISEVSNDFVSDLPSMFNVGDTINATVLSVDEENKQVKLTIKEKKQKKFLEEKGAGFAPLKENLDRWIEEKLEDLKKN